MNQIENYTINDLIEGFNIYYESIIRFFLRKKSFREIGDIKLPDFNYKDYTNLCYLSSIVYNYYLKNYSNGYQYTFCKEDIEDTDAGIFYLYLSAAGIKFNNFESYKKYTNSLITKNRDVLDQFLPKIKTAFSYSTDFLSSMKEKNIEHLEGNIFRIIIDVATDNPSSIKKQEIFNEMKFKIEDNTNILNYCFTVVPLIRNVSTLNPLILTDTPLYINKLK
jgi:hypothetical protein